MPSIKPGLWSVNPADVDSQYLNLWRGLIACVPIFHRGRPVEVVRGSIASVLASAEPTYNTLTRYGRAVDWLRGNDSGIAWPTNLYQEVQGLNEGTLFAILEITGGGDAGHDGMFGYADVSTGAGINFLTSSDEVPRFTFKGNDVAAGTSLQNAGPHFWVGRGRDATYTLEIYRPNGTLFAQASDTITGSMPSTGQLHVGTIPGSSTSVNAQMALGALWGRYLGDAEIRQLIADPFGFITPAVRFSALSSVSLYATATGTIADVVNENDNTTNLHESVDDDPASPNDADWVNNAVEV